MKVKAVGLDFDGVSYDSWPFALDILGVLCKEIGTLDLCDPSAAQKLRKSWGLPGKIMMEILFPDHDPNELLERWRKIEKEIVKGGIPLVPGAKETLIFLKQRGIVIGLITNRSEALFPEIQALGILEYFDFVQTWGEITKGGIPHTVHLVSNYYKPQPQVFDTTFEFLAKSGINPRETIYVDDSLVLHPDYPSMKEAAEQKGITFLGVCTGPIATIQEWVLWGGLPKKNILGSIADLSSWIEKYGTDANGGG